jgi:hypothetical protein
MKTKILLFLAILIIFVGGSVALMLFLNKTTPATQNSNQQNNQNQQIISDYSTTTPDSAWRIYKNIQYGFEIKYPATWQYLRVVSHDTTPFSVNFMDDPGYYEYGGASGPGVYPNKFFNVVIYTGPLTLDKYVERDVGAKQTIVYKKETLISDSNGIIMKRTFREVNTKTDKVGYNAYAERNGYLYLFASIIDSKADISQMESVFNTMLESFKFKK